LGGRSQRTSGTSAAGAGAGANPGVRRGCPGGSVRRVRPSPGFGPPAFRRSASVGSSRFGRCAIDPAKDPGAPRGYGATHSAGSPCWFASTRGTT